ncbi:MAG: hypothetical protein M3T55_06480 [Pseudomonadota bacterium]|nr:hypothetical protein [Pseudomonadota bacterium]
MDYTINHGNQLDASSVVRSSARAAQRTVQDWQREGARDITILDEHGRHIGFNELTERIKRGF